MELIADKKLVSYCFLATLHNSDSDLFDSVYLPIARRALSRYAMKKGGGYAEDLRDEISELYGLRVPTYTIRQMLRALERDMSKRQKIESGFAVLQNGKQFQVRSYVFAELEDAFQRDEASANSIQKAFEAYLSLKSIDPASIPPFIAFFEEAKNIAISFLSLTASAGTDILHRDHRYINHAEFLKYVKVNNPALFEVTKRLYIGAVVATYLESEIDFDERFTSKDEYFLDTQFALTILDLQEEDETEAARELLKIISRCGGKLKLLDVSLDEIRYTIERSLENFNDPLIAHIRNKGIVYACHRRNLKKTDLQRLSSDIEKILQSEYQITVEEVPKLVREKAARSKDVEDLKQARFKPANAIHDVTAYFYVREQRGSWVKSPKKGRYWFLTPNYDLYKFNRTRVPANHIAEIIVPEILTSLLWLRNPQSLNSETAKIGVSELISLGQSQGLPTAEILNDLQSNLRRYTSFTPEHFELLIGGLVNGSSQNINALNDIARRDADEFTRRVQDIIQRERERRAHIDRQIHELKDDQSSRIKEASDAEKRRFLLDARLKELEFVVAQSMSASKEIQEDARQLRGENKRLRRRLIYMSIVIIASAAVAVSSWLGVSPGHLKSVLMGIAGLGGLWGFLNLLINVYKLKKQQ